MKSEGLSEKCAQMPRLSQKKNKPHVPRLFEGRRTSELTQGAGSFQSIPSVRVSSVSSLCKDKVMGNQKGKKPKRQVTMKPRHPPPTSPSPPCVTPPPPVALLHQCPSPRGARGTGRGIRIRARCPVARQAQEAGCELLGGSKNG